MSPTGEAAVPFLEPPYVRGIPSPYYKETHLRFQKNYRAYLEKHFIPHALKWEDEGRVPQEAFESLIADGIFVPTMPPPLPAAALKKAGIHHVVGTPVEEFDYFHLLIFYDEIFRCGVAGPINSMIGGFSIVSPYFTEYASTEVRNRFWYDMIQGRTRWCIAMSEPRGGSDVAGVSTTAIKSADGKRYIINGEKRWISGGVFSDYAITAVRTGGPQSGAAGLSMVVIPLKDHPGVTTERIYCGGQIASGNAHFTFKNVEIPVENLIGREGKALAYMIHNLNHERIAMAACATRQARMALGTAFEYCTRRQAFGEYLVDRSVVRHQLARAGADLEAVWTFLESACYQKNTLPASEVDTIIGPTSALVKAKASLVFQECGLLAVKLLGARGYTRTGEGELVEKLYREIPGSMFPGGAEDVLLDSAIKQLAKSFRNSLQKGDSRL